MITITTANTVVHEHTHHNRSSFLSHVRQEYSPSPSRHIRTTTNDQYRTLFSGAGRQQYEYFTVIYLERDHKYARQPDRRPDSTTFTQLFLPAGSFICPHICSSEKAFPALSPQLDSLPYTYFTNQTIPNQTKPSVHLADHPNSTSCSPQTPKPC